MSLYTPVYIYASLSLSIYIYVHVHIYILTHVNRHTIFTSQGLLFFPRERNPNRIAASCTDIALFSPPDGSNFNLI